MKDTIFRLFRWSMFVLAALVVSVGLFWWLGAGTIEAKGEGTDCEIPTINLWCQARCCAVAPPDYPMAQCEWAPHLEPEVYCYQDIYTCHEGEYDPCCANMTEETITF